MKYLPTISVVVALLSISCAQPDIVIRQGSKFSKESTITLTAGNDNAIFKPELEKELIRRGFNVISDSVAKVISQEKKSGDFKTAGVAASDDASIKEAEKSAGSELTEKSTSRIMKSDYTGKIEYLYKPGKHTVSRLNFTIVELKTGLVVASVGYEQSGTNPEIAKTVAEQLELAINSKK